MSAPVAASLAMSEINVDVQGEVLGLAVLRSFHYSWFWDSKHNLRNERAMLVMSALDFNPNMGKAEPGGPCELKSLHSEFSLVLRKIP